jgi:hypothetical protein
VDIGLKETIIAVITKNKASVSPGGGAPVFYADTDEELEKLAMYISRITTGMVHDLENGTYLIIKH